VALPVAITAEKVQEAVRRIIEVGHPRKIILFGSYTKGTLTASSDLDVLVVGDDSIESTRKESVRIRKALKGLMMPIDLLVVKESHYDTLKNRDGLVYKEIARTGELVYECR